HWSIVSGYLTRYYAAPQTPPRTFPAVRLLGDRISRAIFPALKALTLRYYAASFRRYRKELGLTPVADIFDVIASPHRNLIADLPGFIPCTRLPPHFAYVGPLVWEPDVPDPEWLGRLRADLPTAYVTMGSTGDPKDLSRILAALRDAGWQVMATIGQHDKAPDGVHAVGLARGSSLLRRSQVAVCHGGSGTIYRNQPRARRGHALGRGTRPRWLARIRPVGCHGTGDDYGIPGRRRSRSRRDPGFRAGGGATAFAFDCQRRILACCIMESLLRWIEAFGRTRHMTAGPFGETDLACGTRILGVFERFS
ncbi:MAG: hypothetical protein MUC51_11110, partial [Anaerolineae bacterium]|nr:hypothetical protein [Anaerolineae bacterium]